jgi:hypothetical protein
MLIFWLETQYEPAGRYQCFGRTYCLHLQSWLQLSEKFVFRLVFQSISGVLNDLCTPAWESHKWDKTLSDSSWM